MSVSRGPSGGSFYGVVELDANLKNTITSLETATSELKKLAALDLDYKMPGLAAFRSDTEQMISMLHVVCNKVEDALNERRNESQIIMSAEVPDATSSSSTAVSSFQSNGTSITDATSNSQVSKQNPSVANVIYDFEIKLKLTK